MLACILAACPQTVSFIREETILQVSVSFCCCLFHSVRYTLPWITISHPADGDRPAAYHMPVNDLDSLLQQIWGLECPAMSSHLVRSPHTTQHAHTSAVLRAILPYIMTSGVSSVCWNAHTSPRHVTMSLTGRHRCVKSRKCPWHVSIPQPVPSTRVLPRRAGGVGQGPQQGCRQQQHWAQAAPQ